MNLTPDQSKKFLATIQAKWRPPFQCTCCGANNWSIAESVFQLTEFHGSGMRIGGLLVPVVPVTCNNCGNTLVINALVAGAIEPEKAPAATTPSPVPASTPTPAPAPTLAPEGKPAEGGTSNVG